MNISITSYNYLFKYIIVGDMCVGKSCIMTQFLERKFTQEHDNTIGVEFGSKYIQIKNQTIKIQVWDTAGQESFKSITRSYYRGSICAFLVYDITNRNSFDNIVKWLQDTQTYGNEHCIKILVGNKNDLSTERKVMYEQGQEFAEQNNMLFFETSAKTGENIEQIFHNSAKILVNKIENGEISLTDDTIGIKIGGENKRDLNQDQDGTQQKKGLCC